MSETVQTLLLFLAMAIGALVVGWCLGRSRTPSAPPPEPKPEPEPDPASVSAPEESADKVEEPNSNSNEEENRKESPEAPKDIFALSSELDEPLGRFPTPQSFLDSEALQKAEAEFAKLPPLSADDLIGFIRSPNYTASVLAMRTTLPDDLDFDRLRLTLLEKAESESLLVRTVALQALEKNCAGTLVGPVIGSLGYHWMDSASQELLEDFLRRRLTAGDNLEITRDIQHRDEWDLELIGEVCKRLPEDLRKPLLEAIGKARSNAGDVKSFLQTFGTVLPTIGNQLEDGSPLVATPELEAAAEQVVTNLTRPDHSRSVLLSGHQGVGKSALVTLAAKQLQADGYLLFRATATDIQSGQMYFGQLEERVRNFIEVLRKNKVIWIAESFQEFGLAGRHQYSETSILDMVMPPMQAGTLRVLGEIRPAALDRLAQQAPRLDSAMEIMRVQELPAEETLELAAAWIEQHSGRNGCRPVSSPDALTEGLRLCDQYLNSHHRPGKLLDLLKMAFSTLADRHPNGGEIELHPPAFLAAIATISGMPLEIIDDSRQLDLDDLRALFDQRVMGQPEAVGALVERVAMLKSGLTDPSRPLGVFLFAGPTGTGKTEIAKSLATFLFGSEDRMIRLDMSEFQNPSSLSRITGGPDEPQSLASRIRQQPFSLILLDEFEKADHHVWDLFLQVFDDGRLTDQQGSTADLRNSIIILTSNLGAASAQGTPLGFTQDREAGYQPGEIHKAIEQTFRKEFVNRIDRIVCFRPLSRETMRDILHHQIGLVLKRRGLRNRPWHVEWDHSASEFLLDKGFSPTMGARPLQRAVERYLLGPLADAIVRGEIAEEEQLLFIYARDERLRWDSSIDPVADTGERETDRDAEIKPHSNRTLILHPAGSDDELRSLIQRHEDLAHLLELDAYRERKEECLEAMSTPGFWDDPNRFSALGLAEYIERVESSLRSTGKFLDRLHRDPSRRGPADRFRSLISHNAERLFLLEAAYSEITGEEGWDAFLAIRSCEDPADAAFAAKLGGMYEAWAHHRGMRLAPLHLDLGPGTPSVWAAAIEGFGAWTILRQEAGNHILTEGGRGDTSIVEIRVAPQPPEPPDVLGLSRPAVAEQALGVGPPTSAPPTVRRYQEVPTPLVRDKIANWRTGRLDLVLRGHFDIIGS